MNGTIYSVLLWGSHPYSNNDDCWAGHDTMNLEDARDHYNDPVKHFGLSMWNNTSHIELCVLVNHESEEKVKVPSVYSLRTNPNFKPTVQDDEMAMEAGMLGGCQAYNDMKDLLKETT